LLGRAEYRYNRLVYEFADHYLELQRAGYSPLPDIAAFNQWLSHLHREIRPSLLKAQQTIASHFGFQLGDHVKANGVELYAFKISCYPLEDIVRLEGYSVKKDGKPAQSGTFVEVKETSIVEKLRGSLTDSDLESQLFPSSTRLSNVKSFVQAAIDRLP
jgi:hypothetical protein